MALSNVEINRFNGSTYDTLLPKNTITSTSNPTTSTKGFIGQFYANTSTNPAKMWQCVGESGGVYSWKESSTTLFTDRSPTINDDSSNGFYVGKHLINTNTGEEWICVDDSVGNAVWRSFMYDKTVAPIMTYGVSIDMTNSNPETAVTYTDDAIGMTGGSSTWDNKAIFRDIKPCVLKNGVVQYYLDPNDFTKKADGSAADITSGSAGDVMIEFPKCGYKIETIGNTLTVQITEELSAPGFSYNAFTRDTEGDRDKLYIGAYLGSNLSNKLRSLGNRTPYAGGTAPTGTITTCRTLAQANGSGYDMVSFYPLTLLQCLYLIKYKNLDSQTALGRGYVDGNSAAVITGGTNTKGMYFGEATGKQQMKFAGIEDFWGNLFWWVDGLYSDANRNVLTAFKSFNDTGSGYVNQGQGAVSNINGYMTKPQGTTTRGFITKEVGGSNSTYWCDGVSLFASCLPSFGGSRANASDAGAFYLHVLRSATGSDAGIGARLMYL